MNTKCQPTFIDLFCGCGGFTLGMLRAGFHCKAAIDFNREAIATLKANLKDNLSPALKLTPVEHPLECDLTQFPPQKLAEIIGTHEIDVIVGGPPCQGFSTARQRDGSNHGTERLKDDPRRHLYRQFLDYVKHFRPKIFVIENVLGLRTAAGGKYFTAVQHEARVLGYRVHGQIEKAEDFGVPQKRRRQLVIGVRADLSGYFHAALKPADRAAMGAMLGDAIGDLPNLKAGEGHNVANYDYARRSLHLNTGDRAAIRRKYLFEVLQVLKADNNLTNHVARPHSERDIRDFKKLGEGENSSVAMRRGVEFEFPYDKEVFKDRYTRQHRNRLCSTIVAHLGKDGLMFIHPKQDRSLTPREAARVQTFPDWFVFPEARTYAFRMIGNAVPPLISEAVGNAMKEFLRELEGMKMESEPSGGRLFIPKDEQQAIERLSFVAKFSPQELQALSLDDLLKGWHALFWLFPGLHPDNACDHGTETAEWPEAEKIFPGIRKQKYYLRSGWPVPLVNIGEEAWRRYDKNEITEESFYCAEVQMSRITRRSIATNM